MQQSCDALRLPVVKPSTSEAVRSADFLGELKSKGKMALTPALPVSPPDVCILSTSVDSSEVVLAAALASTFALAFSLLSQVFSATLKLAALRAA
jgi:hypothetical protein